MVYLGGPLKITKLIFKHCFPVFPLMLLAAAHPPLFEIPQVCNPVGKFLHTVLNLCNNSNIKHYHTVVALLLLAFLLNCLAVTRDTYAGKNLGHGHTKVVLPPHMRRRSIKSSNCPQIPISGLVKRSHTHKTNLRPMEVCHHHKSEEDILASASFADNS